MKSLKLLRALILIGMVVGGFEANADTIDFDDLTPGFFLPGDILASQGVTLTSSSIPDAVNVGDTITIFGTSQFNVLGPLTPGAVSLPNYAIGRTVAQSDVLFSFSTPVTTVGLATDIQLDDPQQLVRLIALMSTGNANEFTVLALDEGFSDAVSAPDNLLSVALGGAPFDFALFQVTGGGAEGFDDLTFLPVPLPASVWLFASGLAGLIVTRKRSRSFHRP